MQKGSIIRVIKLILSVSVLRERLRIYDGIFTSYNIEVIN